MNLDIPVIDLVFLGLILIAVIRAVFRGFVKEVLSVAALLLGLLFAGLFSGLVAQLLVPYLGESILVQVLSFLVIFIVVYLITKLLEAGLQNLLEKAALENLDKALGFFVGLVEGVLVVFLILFVAQIQPFFDLEEGLQHSIAYQILSPFFPFATQLVNGGAGDV